MIIHYNNLVFIPGLQDRFKLQELVNIVDHIHRLKIKINISIDEEKTFEKIQHLFLMKTYRVLGMD